MPKTFPPYRSPLMKLFEYAHLPPHLQQASKRFAELAEAVDGVLSVQLELYRGRIADELAKRDGQPYRPEWVQLYPDRFPDNLRGAYLQSERALEKLLEAKDCAVRAAKLLGDAVKAGELAPCDYPRTHPGLLIDGICTRCGEHKDAHVRGPSKINCTCPPLSGYERPELTGHEPGCPAVAPDRPKFERHDLGEACSHCKKPRNLHTGRSMDLCP